MQWVEEERTYTTDQPPPRDPRYYDQYGPDQVHARATWEQEPGDETVVVCVADTGIDPTHEDLPEARIQARKDFTDEPSTGDPRGHGTHVAGIAAAALGNDVGIAGMAQVSLLDARVLDSSGRGSTWWVADGIDWCTKQGADIINLSLGGGASWAVAEAVEDAYREGVLVVASAGNDAGDADNHYPAAFPQAISVSCTTSSGELCSFSNTGQTVELAAPGNEVLSTVPGDDYERWSGTSMSAPHVSGAAALALSANPSLTNEELRERLRGTAQARTEDGHDPNFGYGIVDADLAVSGAPSPPQDLDVDTEQAFPFRTLDWEAPRASPAGDLGAYHVYRGAPGDPYMQHVATVPAGTTSYTDEDPRSLLPKPHLYAVVAENPGGLGHGAETCTLGLQDGGPVEGHACGVERRLETRSHQVSVHRDAHGPPASVTATGHAYDATVTVSGTGDSTGPKVAVSGTGSAYSPQVAASGAGDARGHALAASGAGDATGPVAVSGAGNASGDVPFSVLGDCEGPMHDGSARCLFVDAGGDGEGYWIAVSGLGDADAPVAASGAGAASGWFAASGAGDAHGTWLALSGAGDAGGAIVAVSGTGDANGLVPISVLGSCQDPSSEEATRCFFVSGEEDGEGYWLAASAIGDASAPVAASLAGSSAGDVAASGIGDAEGLVAVSATGEASGCYAVSVTGSVDGECSPLLAHSGCDAVREQAGSEALCFSVDP